MRRGKRGGPGKSVFGPRAGEGEIFFLGPRGDPKRPGKPGERNPGLNGGGKGIRGSQGKNPLNEGVNRGAGSPRHWGEFFKKGFLVFFLNFFFFFLKIP